MIYQLSTRNDGSWGNQGETDEDVVAFAEQLAEMIVDNWPGIDLEVQCAHDFVNRRQPECDPVLADAIRVFANDNFGAAIDLVSANKLEEETS